MNDALINLSNRMKNDLFIGFVGSCRSGKSTLINSFFRELIIPNIEEDFIKHKILDELPQTAEGKQIMTVEPKFIPSTSIELNVNNTLMNLRFVDCVGEIIPSAEGYGSESEPRLVKTPWYNEPLSFKEAASIGTEKVIYNHSNLGIYVTSDGSFSEFSRSEYEEVEQKLIPKLKELNKPFVIVLNSKNPKDSKTQAIAKDLEAKYDVSVVCISALNMTKDEANLILTKALEEFPISDLEISLPDYMEVIGEDIPLKNSIMTAISEIEMKYKKVKDVSNICKELRNTNYFSDVTLELLEASTGKASLILDLDNSKYKEIVDILLGNNSQSRRDFISYLYQSRKANEIYDQVNTAILEAKETGYGVSIPRIEDMKLLPPEIVKKNGMYGVKLSAKAPCIHMIAVDLEASFTPILGTEDQSRMLMDSLESDGNEDDVWNKEFFGKKLSNIVNDSMKSKIHNLPTKSKDKIKGVLDKITNSNHNNLIAIIL